MNRSLRLGGALALGLGLLLATPATAGAAESGVLHPSDIDFSQTRATGHHELLGTGLHVWTDGATSTDKVAGYVATETPLADVGDATLEYTNAGGTPPGYQLVVDLDGDGSNDGILVGEPTYYGADWWLSDARDGFVFDAETPGAGHGYAHAGTLGAWDSAYPTAEVTAFGFSLGSGVKGDGVIDAINFAGVRYTFAEDLILTGKDQCKGGGWATSTFPDFRNQGQCVSHFASKKK